MLFFDIVAANPDAHFALLHPLYKGSSEIILGDGPDDPLLAALDSVLG
jgi:hypothetical protein